MLVSKEQPWFKALEKKSSKKVYAPEDPINFQGELSEHVGLILSGTAKAVSYSENGDETWLGRFSEGEFFGHTSFLTQSPVNFEITAETDMVALLVPVKAIPEMFEHNSEIGVVFARDLAERLDMMMRRLVEALTLSAKGRVCAELIRMSNPIGVDPNRHIVRPNPVFVDLALRINSTRETVSRTVSELQKKGIVSREPGALVIQAPEKLKASVK